MWVTFAASYAAVYEAMVVLVLGIILYAILKARRPHPSVAAVAADDAATGKAGS